MSEKIVQLNEEIIKGQIKELVRGSVVEIFTDLSVWMGIRKAIEQVNANALAA